MQAITVKFIPASNTRPSRLKACAQAGSITTSRGHYCATDSSTDIRMAAEALAARYGWNNKGRLVEGWLPDGKTSVFVFVED